ncbi:hypothetical protein HMPREF3227_00679 [Corynebacterium sp. CMW7794]|uniref:hypothetical protein n=1 Tax=unclassified Corynebacterium TaxID=2624378 RepID=UPI000799BC48|nr:MULTISPECIES: hypothetical protein [unclassified Corynebacterium]KXB56069.1 hypothetical protein HMPREF0307_00731 [Corynebacterium sp. DNF00584]KXI19131.1 hypothetical protein HMPREF3227_00679 [Corynebacterium sp. CMW7794]OFL78803.1 hypothetical protein HMPREF2748_12040 [Corynebacterium sp. HMSC077B05]OFP20968.1 hypothetical protein HMPREF2998_06710 [Corynebacterium sp. HMSC065A05]OFP69375.1 hypothetical protein HMPREF2976_07065 [Corynebacterium sp. HMSC077D10]
MRARRLSVALVAATSTALALVTPVAGAESSESQGASSAQSQDSGSSEDTASDGVKPGGEGKEGITDGEKTDGTETTKTALSKECQAEVDAAKEAHKKAVKDGTAGSSFMGPQELALGIVNGYGSSGMPDKPDCVEKEKDDKPVELPDWLKWAELSPEGKEAFAWINLILSVIGGLIGLASTLVKVNPEFGKDINGALTGMLKQVNGAMSNAQKQFRL